MSTPTPHQTVVEDAAAKIAALEHALQLATSRTGSGFETEADSEAQAQSIVSAARKEAFQLITEARKEAGLVIAEARSEAQQFQQQPATDLAPGSDDNSAEVLRGEELQLEARIVELQATLAGLESGIRSLTGMLATSSGTQPVETPAAAPPPPAFADHPSSQPISLEGEHQGPAGAVANNGGEALVEPLLPPQRTFSASPPPPPSEPEPAPAVLVEDLTVEVADQHEQVPALEGGTRASFYSRRSAQLPHIGADAGHRGHGAPCHPA